MMQLSGSYDLQTFTDGGWRTVRAFRTREEAVRQARTLEVGPGCQAVRVLHETYDQRKNRFIDTTIFRRSVLNQDRIDAARADLAVARLLRRRRPARAVPARPADEWRLASSFGIRVLALMTGGAFVLALVERIVML